MTIEEKLKKLILSKYPSVLSFTESIGMPYATMQSIFKRGIQNSSVTNIIKICHALGISADELAKNRIVCSDLKDLSGATKIEDLAMFVRTTIESSEQLTYADIPLSDATKTAIIDAIDLGMEFVRRQYDRTV